MSRKNGTTDAAGRDERGWDEGESLDRGPADAGAGDSEDEVIVAGDEDLDELDAPIDPDFSEVEAWDLEDLDDADDEEEDDEAEDDEAEMHLLHELGIDLDAPDGEAGLDLALDLDEDDPADDGVAA
jgi:ribonuclease E